MGHSASHFESILSQIDTVLALVSLDLRPWLRPLPSHNPLVIKEQIGGAIGTQIIGTPLATFSFVVRIFRMIRTARYNGCPT
jgi:hypothetical protein